MGEEVDEGVGYDDERGRRTRTRTKTMMKTIAEAAESTNEAVRTAYARSVLMDHWRREDEDGDDDLDEDDDEECLALATAAVPTSGGGTIPPIRRGGSLPPSSRGRRPLLLNLLGGATASRPSDVPSRPRPFIPRG